MLLKIPESVQTGTVFPLKIAQDFDIGSDTVQNYSQPQIPFSCCHSSSWRWQKIPRAGADKALDQEKQPELSLTLTALDGGAPPRSGASTVLIEVVDINDNAPRVFTVRL